MVSCTEVEGERTEGMEKTEQRGKAGRIDAGQKKDAASVGSQDSKKNKRCTVQRKQQRWIQQVLWSNNERRNQRERREHFVSPFFPLGLCEKPSFDTHCSSCCSQVSLQFQRLLSVYQMLVHLFSRPIPMNLVPKFFLSSPLGGSFKNSKRHESFFFNTFLHEENSNKKYQQCARNERSRPHDSR